MSNPMSWEFHGRNKDWSPLTSKQIEALVALDEDDLLVESPWENEDTYLNSFDTESFGALTRIRSALEKWARLYPDAELFVMYRYECAWNPDGFLVKNGTVHDLTGHIKFSDDFTGEGVTQF